MKKLTSEQKLNALAAVTVILGSTILFMWAYVAANTLRTANKEIVCVYDKTQPYKCKPSYLGAPTVPTPSPALSNDPRY